MTSLSRKKRRTTRPNTVRASRSSGRPVAWLAIAASVSVAVSAATIAVAAEPEKESLLDRRSRSSVEARWEALRSAYLSDRPARNEPPVRNEIRGQEVNSVHVHVPTAPSSNAATTSNDLPSSNGVPSSNDVFPSNTATSQVWSAADSVSLKRETQPSPTKPTENGTSRSLVPTNRAVLSRRIDANDNREVSQPATSTDVTATSNAGIVDASEPTNIDSIRSNSHPASTPSVDAYESPLPGEWSTGSANGGALSVETDVTPETVRRVDSANLLPSIYQPIGNEFSTNALDAEPPATNPFEGFSPIVDLVLPEPVAVLDDANPSNARSSEIGSDTDLAATFDRLRLKPLSDIVPSADYTAGDDRCQFLCPSPETCSDESAVRCPKETDLPSIGGPDRNHPQQQYHWTASNVTYNPIYFEDARLERYGQHIPEPLQSLKSVALFAGQFASLPYQMALDPVHERVSPLGFYRPGEAAPCLKRAVPWNKKAVAASAGAYTGLIFLIP